MISIHVIGLALAAYILGSIPSAVLVGKSFFGMDVRDYGSMNAGATNTFRVLGRQAGSAVLLLDIIKAITAANLVYFLPNVSELTSVMSFKIAFGMIAVLGHIYPVLAHFKGGKGIATLLGLVIAIDPILALGCILIFLIILMITRMVSAGSILTTLSFGILSYIRYGLDEPVLQIFGIFAVILVLYTHRANMVRIWKGEEKKTSLFKKKQES